MLKSEFWVEPWDQVKSIKVSTLCGFIELKEEDDAVFYRRVEYGCHESVDYKFRLLKRQDYKEYLKYFAEVDVDIIDLKDLVGVMSYFREVYHHVVSLYRRGTTADLTFRWRDRDTSVAFSLYASKGKEESEIQSLISAERGNEHVFLRHSEKVLDAEEGLERHTKEAVGLYMLFKEYVLAQEEAGKT